MPSANTVAELQVVVNADTSSAERSLETLGTKVGGVGSTLATAFTGAAVAGIAAVAAGLTASVAAASDFETSMSGIKAVSGATSAQMEEMSKLALQLGADTSFSAKEAADGISELVKAGVSMSDIMSGAGKASLDLAAAGGVSVADAATLAAQAMNIFNIKGADMTHVADQIAGAANASAIDVGQFKFSLSAAGTVAATVGFSFDDLATAIAVVGQNGLVGSDAGTSLKTMMLALQPQTKKQTDAFKELGLITKDGANQFFDATGKVKSMAQVAGILQTALKGQTEQQRVATLQTLFGTDAVRAAAIMAKTGAAGFDDMAASMGKVSAADVAATRLDNLKGSIEKMTGSLSTMAITIGLALTPMLKDMVDWATEMINAWLPAVTLWANAIPGAVKTTVTALQSTLAPIITWLTVTGLPLLQSAFAVVGAYVTTIWLPILSGLWDALSSSASGGLGTALTWLTVTGFPHMLATMQSVSAWITSVWQPAVVAATASLVAGVGVALTWLTTTGWPLMQAAMAAVADWITTTLIPTLTSAWSWLSEKLGVALTWLTTTGWPLMQAAMAAVGGWVIATLIPTLTSVWSWLSEKVGAALTWLTETAWPKMGEAANAVQNWIHDTLIPTLTDWYTWFDQKLQPIYQWFTTTGWPALQTAGATVWAWLVGPFFLSLSEWYSWFLDKLRPIYEWFTTTGWPALQAAGAAVKSWLTDSLFPTLSEWYVWLQDRLSPIFTWFITYGWPMLKRGAADFATTLSDLNAWLGRVFDKMDQRGVFVELHGAWSDLVDIGGKLWKDIIEPLTGAVNGSATAAGDATDSADDWAAALLGVATAIHTVTTWLDHLIDLIHLSIDGWIMLGKAAQWAASAAGAKVTGGDVPDFPSMPRRPTWLDQAPDTSTTRHRGTAPSSSGGSSGGGGGSSGGGGGSSGGGGGSSGGGGGGGGGSGGGGGGSGGGGGGGGGGANPPPLLPPPPPPGGGGQPGTGSDVDNSSLDSFYRTALPYALDAAGGNRELAAMMLAAAHSENGSVGGGGPIWAYNFFGLKGTGPAGTTQADTWEWVNGQRVYITDNFRMFHNAAEGMHGFLDFLTENSRYGTALANFAKTGDAVGLFRDANAAGYATNPTWWSFVKDIRDSGVRAAIGYQGGGWAGLHGPELAWLGERGPEYVVPNAALRGSGVMGGAPQHITIDVAIGGAVAEQIYVTGRDLAVRRGRGAAGAGTTAGPLSIGGVG